MQETVYLSDGEEIQQLELHQQSLVSLDEEKRRIKITKVCGMGKLCKIKIKHGSASLMIC